jgi:hypothetical protein
MIVTIQRFLIAFVLVLLPVSTASAQQWASKMFEVREHDFGVVVRGSQQQFRFEFTNLYEEDVHIERVRSSCGCTSPSIEKSLVSTFQKSAILATFNTRTLQGPQGATLTVVFDKPFRAEVRLQVKGSIRTDVVFQPGSVQFGDVVLGSPVERMIAIQHAGADNWEIRDVRSVNSFYKVFLKNRTVTGGRVDYQLLVQLTGKAPAGYLNDQLILVTNDLKDRELRLAVEGRITSPLTISPASLLMGPVAPGESISRKLVVRGNKPFRILKVSSDGEGFKCTPADDARMLHLLPVSFTAGDEAGTMVQTILVETDLGEGTTARCVATVEVKPAP